MRPPWITQIFRFYGVWVYDYCYWKGIHPISSLYSDKWWKSPFGESLVTRRSVRNYEVFVVWRPFFLKICVDVFYQRKRGGDMWGNLMLYESVVWLFQTHGYHCWSPALLMWILSVASKFCAYFLLNSYFLTVLQIDWLEVADLFFWGGKLSNDVTGLLLLLRVFWGVTWVPTGLKISTRWIPESELRSLKRQTPRAACNQAFAWCVLAENSGEYELRSNIFYFRSHQLQVGFWFMAGARTEWKAMK